LQAARAEQQRAIVAYCSEHGLKLEQVLCDALESVRTSWLEREVGRQLKACLAQGDVVVVASGRYVYSSAPDLLAVVQNFRRQGIGLHFADTDTEVGEATVVALGLFVQLQSTCRSEGTRRGIADRRAQGKRYTRYPGYGFQWAGRRGCQVRAPDQREHATILEIVRRRDRGESWWSIARQLLLDGVHTAAGMEWSPSRVRRAYRSFRHTTDDPYPEFRRT
jgi:DNA invertase Pin-like site-specific DNA recombinase